MIDDDRRRSFDAVAEGYEVARPTYPSALVDEVVRWARLAPDSRLLEVGAGTGKATRAIAARGYRVTCVEPGANLAAVARRALAEFPQVEVREATFEEALLDPPYDLIYAAQSWHWIDPAIGYDRAADLLRPGGTLALFWNQLDEEARTPDDYFAANMAVYEREAPDLARQYREAPPRPEGVANHQAKLRASGRFDSVTLREFRWSQTRTAEEYLALINTYSDHRVLPDEVRARLFHALRCLIDDQFGGQVTKPYVTALHLARAANQNLID